MTQSPPLITAEPRAHLLPPKAAERPHRPTNISQTERIATALAGALMAYFGLKQGRKTGIIALALGGAVAYRAYSGYCPVYQALGVAEQPKPKPKTAPSALARHLHFRLSRLVNKGPDELYRFWRDVQNLPKFMTHIQSVVPLDERRSRWTALGPAGAEIQWDALIIDDRPNQYIAWQTFDEPVRHVGSVEFEPVGDASRVTVDMTLQPTGGAMAMALAKALGTDPYQQTKDDLRRFKSLMEAGEIATVQGQPSGQCTQTTRPRFNRS